MKNTRSIGITPTNHTFRTTRTQMKGTTVIAVVFVVAIIGGSALLVYFNSLPKSPFQTSACNPQTTGSYILQFKVTDAIATGTVPASLTIDIINPASLSGPLEKITGAASNPQTTANRYQACQSLYYHAYSTGGNGYYDQYQPFQVPANPSIGACSNAQTCFDLTGTPWTLTQRTTTANAAAGVSACTGSATFARSTALSTTSAGSSTGTADCSPGTGVRTANFVLTLSLAGASTCLGNPTPYLNPITSGVQDTLGLTIWMSINSTTPPSVSAAAASGALTSLTVSQPTSTTKWTTWAWSAAPICASPGLTQSGTTSITFTFLYSGTVGQRVMFWFQDQQQTNIVASGSTSAPPVNVGAFTGAGTTTTVVVNANSYQLSSGIPSAPVLAFTINVT